MEDKVIRDGKVAVLISPGFGAGWSTWGGVSPFCPALVEAIEAGLTGEQLQDVANKVYPDEYNGGACDLVIHWVDQGTLFKITEYDGSESLELKENTDWIVA